jgi:integrase
MPRPCGSTDTPKYRLHKKSRQAVVTLNGKDFYLGPHGTKTSKAEYDRVVAEWLAAGRTLTPGGGGGHTVVEVISAFLDYAEVHYRSPGGSSGELNSYKLVIGLLRRLYGRHEATAFGPVALTAVRQAMVQAGWTRSYINSQVGRIRRMFKWAVAHELVPSATWEALRSVDGLRAGKTDAKESEPVTPVPELLIDGVLAHAPPQVAAMIRIQLLTGMRPGEVCQMSASDIDTSGGRGVWLYRPPTHKTMHRGHERTIHLGPKAQAVLSPFMNDGVTFLFSPAAVDAWHRQRRAAARRTPLNCGNVAGSNRARNPKRRPRDRYTVNSYGAAIKRACQKAFPPPQPLCRAAGETHRALSERLTAGQMADLRRWRIEHAWHPHQLRHNAATRLRRDFGLEAAQVILGHRTLTVTQVYAERNAAKAHEVMAAVG